MCVRARVSVSRMTHLHLSRERKEVEETKCARRRNFPYHARARDRKKNRRPRAPEGCRNMRAARARGANLRSLLRCTRAARQQPSPPRGRRARRAGLRTGVSAEGLVSNRRVVAIENAHFLQYNIKTSWSRQRTIASRPPPCVDIF